MAQKSISVTKKFILVPNFLKINVQIIALHYFAMLTKIQTGAKLFLRICI